MIEIVLPALSPTMEEATLATWLVGPGDAVRRGDIIAEIETDKATMELEAEHDGVLERLLVAAGTEGVLVDTAIAILSVDGQGASAPPERPAAQPSPIAAPAAPPAPVEPAPIEAVASASPPTAPQPNTAPSSATPLARRIAALAALDLGGVEGSGPHGKILRRDVDAVLGRTRSDASVPAQSLSVSAVVVSERMPALPVDTLVTPLDGMRRTIARRMTESFRDIPHFPLSIDVCADRLVEVRAQLNTSARDDDEKVSLNDLMIKAAARALIAVPDANVSYTPEGLAHHAHADIAMAVAIDGGLITPIIRAAEAKGVRTIAAETKALARRAREKKLRPEEFSGGTFSISNLGMFGIRSFSSIINEPQGAILSIGSAEPRPIVRGGEIVIATMITVTLTCDHRAMDGAIGARWLATFRSMVEEPLLLI